jgi:hypothetical protein
MFRCHAAATSTPSKIPFRSVTESTADVWRKLRTALVGWGGGITGLALVEAVLERLPLKFRIQ